MKLLITEKKGKTFRLLDTNSNEIFRVFERDFKDIDFIVGTLFDCEYKSTGDMIEELTVNSETIGDSTKERVELSIEEYKVGDLHEGTPIIKFGKAYAKKGVKVAYAYFK